MIAGIRSVAAVLAAASLLGAAPSGAAGKAGAAGAAGKAAAGVASRAPSWETRILLTLSGQATVTRGHHVGTSPVDDGFAETRKVKVLATAGGAPSRIEVTYDAVHRNVIAPGVPAEAAGRTFVVTRGGGAHPVASVTEGGKKVKAYLAAEIAHDVVDLFRPDPFVAAAATLAATPRAPVALDPGVVTRLLDLGAHTRVTKATLTLRRAHGGRALLHLQALLTAKIGERPVTGTLAGPVVVDTEHGRLSWMRLAGDLAGAGKLVLDLPAEKGKKPRRLTGHAVVKVKLTFSLSRSYR